MNFHASEASHRCINFKLIDQMSVTVRQICGIQHFALAENEECILEYLCHIYFYHIPHYNFAFKKVI